MNKKKIEIILNSIAAVLAIMVAVAYAIDKQWVFASLFMLIGVLNIVGVFLRLKNNFH